MTRYKVLVLVNYILLFALLVSPIVQLSLFDKPESISFNDIAIITKIEHPQIPNLVMVLISAFDVLAHPIVIVVLSIGSMILFFLRKHLYVVLGITSFMGITAFFNGSYGIFPILLLLFFAIYILLYRSNYF